MPIERIWLQVHDAEVRAKAIDKFAKELLKRAEGKIVDVHFNDGLYGEVVEIDELKKIISEIGEQLKEGGK